MSNLETIMNAIYSHLKKILLTLTSSRKHALITVAALAVAICYCLLTSCGVTRTTVRTNGKGTTNATISVTTNNPTSVSVETKLDSTKLMINKASK